MLKNTLARRVFTDMGMEGLSQFLEGPSVAIWGGEGVAELAKEITAKLSIPTIGIGAGPDCDGQVLVLHDVLGLSDMSLKFTKHYAELRDAAISATAAFVDEVREGVWPDDAHSFH